MANYTNAAVKGCYLEALSNVNMQILTLLDELDRLAKGYKVYNSGIDRQNYQKWYDTQIREISMLYNKVKQKDQSEQLASQLKGFDDFEESIKQAKTKQEQDRENEIEDLYQHYWEEEANKFCAITGSKNDRSWDEYYRELVKFTKQKYKGLSNAEFNELLEEENYRIHNAEETVIPTDDSSDCSWHIDISGRVRPHILMAEIEADMQNLGTLEYLPEDLQNFIYGKIEDKIDRLYAEMRSHGYEDRCWHTYDGGNGPELSKYDLLCEVDEVFDDAKKRCSNLEDQMRGNGRRLAEKTVVKTNATWEQLEAQLKMFDDGGV